MPPLKRARAVEREDGTRHLMKETAPSEEYHRSEVGLAVRSAVRGDAKPLIKILLSGRPLDAQERGAIQDYIDGKFRKLRADPAVAMAAGEVKRRQRMGVRREDAVTEVAADYDVDPDALNYFLRRSKKPRSKKPRSKKRGTKT
jgi:hypothetical protein